MLEKDKQNPTPERIGCLTYWRIVNRLRVNPTYKDVNLSLTRNHLVEYLQKNWSSYLSLHTKWLTKGCPWHLTPSVDRIDTNRGYEEGNIQFIAMGENSKKRKTNILFNGETAAEASRRLGGNRHLVKTRIKQGWSKERAFTQELVK